MNNTTISQSNYSIENDSHITFIETKIPYKKNAALYCLFLITSLTISIVTYAILNQNNKTNLTTGFIICFIVSSNVSVYIISKIVVLYLMKFLDTNSFLKLIVEKQRRIIEILLTSFISYYIVKYIEAEQKITFKSSIYFTIASTLIFFMLLRIILGEGTNYLLHLNNYYKKLNDIDNDMKILYLLNSVVPGQINNNIHSSNKYIKMVFKTLSPDFQPLDMHTISNFFSQTDTVSILNKFDIKKNNKIPLDQFINVWTNIVVSKKSLKTIVEHKDNLLNKLDTIFLIILFPLGLFIIMSILGNTQQFTTIFAILTGCFFSLSFVFGPVIGDLFKSIIFIFLVRPFEVGDVIEFDDLIYVVEEPGLMYSTLKHDALLTIVQNNKIMDKNIINYRISDFIEKNYNFKSDIQLYKNNINNLKQQIRKLIKKYSYTFEEKFYLNNIQLLDNKNLSFNVKVKAYLHSVNYEEEIDKFSIELSQLVNSIINSDKEKNMSDNILNSKDEDAKLSDLHVKKSEKSLNNLDKMNDEKIIENLNRINNSVANIDNVNPNNTVLKINDEQDTNENNKENIIENDNLIKSELKSEVIEKLNKEIKKNEEDVEEI